MDRGFVQNLANKMNVVVYASANCLWVTSNGNYFVAGMINSNRPNMKDIGFFKTFIPGGH